MWEEMLEGGQCGGGSRSSGCFKFLGEVKNKVMS